MPGPLALIASVGLGYLLGSVPFGVLVTRLWRGVDVRSGGSGHTGGLNTIRMAGLLPGLIVAFADMGKAVVAVLIGQALDPSGWGAVLAGSAAIAGHCWPVFAGFRGGMGFASGIAVLLYVRFWSVPILVLVFVAWLAVFRHFPRSQAATAASMPAVLWVMGSEPPLLAFGFLAGGIVFLRHLHDLGRRKLTLGLR
ncbi:MAG: glycerol-3-phosphate acyltransferase [Anaerolineae bacterium]